ncbi:hypothetical protein SAMN05421504_101671 [Amycolatopsis xylanica]|uniref:Uncharacterized protein n=1 Tax=Amycolatopsis xylanica TaxID=589385 RepID=A0A1H2TUD1_9PSEU|nr:hypothetical protein [Amycolatopsis xylanica]SDW46939.1 hypothetical protein SAMN05421504_101671 [Amycolatopsis xylanica]
MTHPVRTPVVAADGGLVRFDLAELLSGTVTSMRIEVTDASAEPWLTRLCGPENALAALDGEVAVPVVPELAGLALLLWARRWWPASAVLGIVSLDPALLDVEAAVATAAVEDVAEGMLDGFEATPGELFDSAADALLAAAGPVAGEVRGLCERLAVWFDERDDVVRAEAAAELAGRLESLAPSQRSYALAAGTPQAAAGAGVLAEGRASVDWARVPPGVLDAADDTVAWRIVTAEGAARLRVEVAGAFADAALTAFATRDGEVFAEVPLALGVGGFAGSVELDERSARLVAERDVHIGVEIGAEPVFITTPDDRAAVVALVRAREGLPLSVRTVAERAAAGAADEEF